MRVCWLNLTRHFLVAGVFCSTFKSCLARDQLSVLHKASWMGCKLHDVKHLTCPVLFAPEIRSKYLVLNKSTEEQTFYLHLCTWPWRSCQVTPPTTELPSRPPFCSAADRTSKQVGGCLPNPALMSPRPAVGPDSQVSNWSTKEVHSTSVTVSIHIIQKALIPSLMIFSFGLSPLWS